MFDCERFNLTKLNELEVGKENQIEVTNSFEALGNLNNGDDINKAWENIKETVKTVTKDCLGLHQLKQHKHCFDEECLQF